MSTGTKITLSDKELSLVTNADWILTKQVIIQKVYQLFAESVPALQSILMQEQVMLPPGARSSVPKIYKGENYLQLPYVMFDYPRSFNKENIFAVRTMFWWANFFSITLHISGDHVKAVKKNIIKNKQLLNHGFFIGINENQWEHHFETNNFLSYQALSAEQQMNFLDENEFIKLALKFDLQQWNNMPALLTEGYKKIALLLS